MLDAYSYSMRSKSMPEKKKKKDIWAKWVEEFFKEEPEKLILTEVRRCITGFY